MSSFTDKKNQDAVPLQDLCFYFDAQEKDRLDHGLLGRKTGQVLALREKLLSMPEGEFDLAIKTIEKLVAETPARSLDGEKHKVQKRRLEAQELFDRVKKSNQRPVRASEKASKV